MASTWQKSPPGDRARQNGLVSWLIPARLSVRDWSLGWCSHRALLLSRGQQRMDVPAALGASAGNAYGNRPCWNSLVQYSTAPT